MGLIISLYMSIKSWLQIYNLEVILMKIIEFFINKHQHDEKNIESHSFL